MAKPIRILNAIYDITPELISNENIKGILVDMDNTLLRWDQVVISEKSKMWIKTMQECGVKICIITNSGIERTSLVMKDTGYDYIHTALKPLPFNFIKGRRKLGVKKENMLVVGDQMMTDALGSKIVGFKCIIVEPMSLKEQKITHVNRFFEKLFFGRDVKGKKDE